MQCAYVPMVGHYANKQLQPLLGRILLLITITLIHIELLVFASVELLVSTLGIVTSSPLSTNLMRKSMVIMPSLLLSTTVWPTLTSPTRSLDGFYCSTLKAKSFQML
jgi:hypothetical protein